MPFQDVALSSLHTPAGRPPGRRHLVAAAHPSGGLPGHVWVQGLRRGKQLLDSWLMCAWSWPCITL